MRFIVGVGVCFLCQAWAGAQTLSLDRLIERAIDSHPSVRSQLSNEKSAQSGIETAKYQRYDYSLYGNLIGELIDISPDTLSDTNAQGSLVNTPNGQPSVYYKVNIRLAKEQTNPKAQLIEIKPGMTASIDIRTGTRNLLNYLMKPVIKTLGNSLNER